MCCADAVKVKPLRGVLADDLDSDGAAHSLPEGLRDAHLAACKPDDRGRLAPFPLAGRAGGWVGCRAGFMVVFLTPGA
jgi:hypothetical protein